MIRKYLNASFIYAVTAMVFGVFYREFTKFNGFTGKTNLSVIHTHYFLLGMFFFLILMLLEKSFSFSKEKNTGKIIIFYQIGLNITGLGFFLRGFTQVLEMQISYALDASMSGIAGCGHFLMGVSLLLLFRTLKKAIPTENNAPPSKAFHVPPKYLLLIASFVWMFAGANILRIGIRDFVQFWNKNPLYLLGAIAVFLIFMIFIFYRLVEKHNRRIVQMEQATVPFYLFFDRKSYLIMIFMITGGILLRSSHLLPSIAIGVLYCGIGTSLEGAGILFLQKFVLAMKSTV